jgi:hypothetical protein
MARVFETIQRQIATGRIFQAKSWRLRPGCVARVTIGPYRFATGRKGWVLIDWSVAGGEEHHFYSVVSLASYIQQVLSRNQIREVFKV